MEEGGVVDFLQYMKDRERYFVLEGREIKPVADVLEWARWFEVASFSGERRVGRDEIGSKLVSTVFLGIDHGWTPGGVPILFETMVFEREQPNKPDRLEDFGCDKECGTWRYATYEEAEAGHAAIVERIKSGQTLEDWDFQP